MPINFVGISLQKNGKTPVVCFMKNTSSFFLSIHKLEFGEDE